MKAFPTEHSIAGMMDLKSDGMDLRDYFAAKALEFSLQDVGLVGVADIEEIEIAVNLAYKIADAMIKERNKNDS
jgi:hypothetical protein